MEIQRAAQSLYILRDIGDVSPASIAAALQHRAPAGLIEAVPSYETVGVHVDPLVFDPSAIEDLRVDGLGVSPAVHRVPVCYELGEDLGSVAVHVCLTPEEVVAEHSGLSYTCAAIGFCPGFPYLWKLSERLQGVPRRKSPRTAVPRGSVGITGIQTGIYPSETPGGWALIGRTPLVIVHQETSFFPIKPGDQIRFVSIDLDEFQRLEGKRLGED